MITYEQMVLGTAKAQDLLHLKILITTTPEEFYKLRIAGYMKHERFIEILQQAKKEKEGGTAVESQQ